jgi:hypothetical protein
MAVRDIVQAAAGVGGGENLYVEDVFSTYLYQNTNTSSQTITNGIDLAGEGGLVWIKWRNLAASHALTDTERGAGEKLLYTDLTDGENAYSQVGVSSFNSDGFVAGGTYNQGSYLSASWTFRKAPKFFDIVTYTGTGSARTVSHNLGSVPGCIIVKRTDTTGDWQVYHRANTANPETDYLVLNSSAATVDSNTRWNDTLPTDSVFTVGTEATVNASGGTYVAYLFAHDAGGFGDDGEQNVISCGSFTNSGTVNINLGWEPQWLLLKRPDATGAWFMIDTMRGWTADATATYLLANASDAESAIGAFDGIRPSATGISASGGGGNTYIYIAIRRGPMKTPESGTEVFDIDTRDTTPAYDTTFPVDMALQRDVSSTEGMTWNSRLQGTNRMLSSSTGAETSSAANTWDFMNGWYTSSTTSATQYSWMFRRAPGFFDVVCFTAPSSGSWTVPHNLGVQPELVISKRRDSASIWPVTADALGNDGTYLALEQTTAAAFYSGFQVASPTEISYSSGSWPSAANVVVYMFATLAGVSKVGSYTGTGTTLQVDCGFSAGARLVIIKRTDATGDWYLWDSARGIVSGNDPYLLLNSTAAEVTSTDYIDPYSAGFEISSTAPAAINASGGSFVFLAVA